MKSRLSQIIKDLPLTTQNYKLLGKDKEHREYWVPFEYYYHSYFKSFLLMILNGFMSENQLVDFLRKKNDIFIKQMKKYYY